MPLSPAALDAAAAHLVEARRTRRLIDDLPDHCRPSTLDEGYAIQDRVRAALGPVAGWKTGATAAPVQARFGIDAPFTGPFFATDVYASPALRPASQHHHRAIESEFAFRLGKPLAPRQAAYTRAEVLDAVDALIPAMEIVGPRTRELPFGRAPLGVADTAINEAMVLGTAVTGWQRFDLPSHAVTLRVNGKIAAEGKGAAVLGDPMTALVWTVNFLTGRGLTLEAGQIFSTGTTTGIVVLQPGDAAVADFGALGQVALTFSA